MRAPSFNTILILAVGLAMSACGKNGFQVRDMKKPPSVLSQVENKAPVAPSENPAPKLEAEKSKENAKPDDTKPDPTGTMGVERSSGTQNPATGAQNTKSPDAPSDQAPATAPALPKSSATMTQKVLEFFGMAGNPDAKPKSEKTPSLAAAMMQPGKTSQAPSVGSDETTKEQAARIEKANSAIKTRFRPGGKKPGIWTRLLESKFGQKLNAVFNRGLTEKEKVKWKTIFFEMQRVTTNKDREELLFIDKDKASDLVDKFEADPLHELSPVGAYTMAVNVTAVRHKFPQTPCAEFMSEIIRQAYKRAGYDLAADFSPEKKSQLIWSHTALVTTLGNSLLRAGWTVWDNTKFHPPVGAILMHTAGTSPSHTYMSAGDDGNFIIDNAHPRGFDLRTAPQKLIDFEYSTGAFFLPPGQVPAARSTLPETNP